MHRGTGITTVFRCKFGEHTAFFRLSRFLSLILVCITSSKHIVFLQSSPLVCLIESHFALLVSYHPVKNSAAPLHGGEIGAGSFGLVLFRALGGRFNAVAPSALHMPGAFGRLGLYFFCVVCFLSTHLLSHHVWYGESLAML